MDRLFMTLMASAAFVFAATINAAAVDFEGFRYELTDLERSEIEQIVACEAGADVFEGQVAVALCIKNYCRINDCTVDDAIRALQITTYKRDVTDENREAVLSAWDYNIDLPTEEPIEFWCTPKAAEAGAWHESQRFVGQYGAHRFYARNNR